MNCNEAVKLLDSILDCQASDKEREKFFKHLDKCAPCFGHYELDRLFTEFVKKHDGKNCCPPELMKDIRDQIKTLP